MALPVSYSVFCGSVEPGPECLAAYRCYLMVCGYASCSVRLRGSCGGALGGSDGCRVGTGHGVCVACGAAEASFDCAGAGVDRGGDGALPFPGGKRVFDFPSLGDTCAAAAVGCDGRSADGGAGYSRVSSTAGGGESGVAAGGGGSLLGNVGDCGAGGRARVGAGGDAVGSGVALEGDAESAVGEDTASAVGGPFRGLRYLRNRGKKDRRKARKIASGDWRETASPSNVWERSGTAGGFWNSCSEQTRRKLIESKASMHIAENAKREAEARARVNYLDSPEALARKAYELQMFKQEKARKIEDEKVGSWVRTVASASVESVARSAPASVPSFDELVKELDSASEAARATAVAELTAVVAEKESAVLALRSENSDLSSKATLVEQEVLRLRAEVEAEKKKSRGARIVDGVDYLKKFSKASHDKIVAETEVQRLQIEIAELKRCIR